MKQILLKKDNQVLGVLVNDQGNAENIFCSEYSASLLGRIVIARVKDVVKNINAVFVDIGGELNAYLPMDDIGEHTVFTKKTGKKLICKDDELLVMVSREAMKTKQPSVTTKLVISGKLCALIHDGKKGVFFSKKIHDEAFKKNIKEEVDKSIELEETVIIRTNAESESISSVIHEVAGLYKTLTDIILKAGFQTAVKTVYQTIPEWAIELRDIKSDSLSEVITDDNEIYEYLRDNREGLLDEGSQITLYDDKLLPLKKCYSIEKKLEDALAQRVWLRCGGYLVIEYTEALTAIDVNSGKNDMGKDKEKAILKVNIEAAREAARQIHIRNLSGIILIDFINMTDEENKKELISYLSGLLARDNVKTVLLGLTRLELCEITRKKVKKPLYQTNAANFIDKNT